MAHRPPSHANMVKARAGARATVQTGLSCKCNSSESAIENTTIIGHIAALPKSWPRRTMTTYSGGAQELAPPRNLLMSYSVHTEKTIEILVKCNKPQRRAAAKSRS